MTAPAAAATSDRPTLAVVGATGAVGTVLLALLGTRRDVWGEIRVVSSRGSAGRRLKVRGQELVVLELTADAFDGVDVAIFATPVEVSAHWAPPREQAAMFSRPPLSADIAIAKPRPSSPSIADAGTRTPSRMTCRVGCACQPIFFSGAPKLSPSASPGTRNALMPRAPGSPVRAITT